MPAGYTHYIFGEQVLDQLDENIKKRIMPTLICIILGFMVQIFSFIMMSIKRIPLNH